jgi:hypothetical protein
MIVEFAVSQDKRAPGEAAEGALGFQELPVQWETVSGVCVALAATPPRGRLGLHASPGGTRS